MYAVYEQHCDSYQSLLQDNTASYPAHAKLTSILTNVLEELHDVPLYYNTHDLSKILKVTPPPQNTFRSALVNAGQYSCHPLLSSDPQFKLSGEFRQHDSRNCCPYQYVLFMSSRQAFQQDDTTINACSSWKLFGISCTCDKLSSGEV